VAPPSFLSDKVIAFMREQLVTVAAESKSTAQE
jgi:hypothetical protein